MSTVSDSGRRRRLPDEHRARLGTPPASLVGGFAPYRKKEELVPCRKRQGRLFLFLHRAQWARFTNLVVSGFQRRVTVPMGPFLCFAMMTSASFGCSVSLL